MVRGSEEWKRNAAKKQRAWYASLSDEQKEANAAKHRGKPTNTGKKFGPQSPERRAAQSVRLKAYIASLTPEQREARMAPARRAQPAAWKEICAAKTKDERRAMLAAANAVNPIMHARQEATP
jgi:hypothetical protein